MKGMTFDEFKEVLLEGWEMDFIIDGKEFHYQRSGNRDKFDIYLTTAEETLYQAETDDMQKAYKELLDLPLLNGKNAEQLQAKITVISST